MRKGYLSGRKRRDIDPKISSRDLVNVAIQSLTHKRDLSEFWSYVNSSRSLGILTMDDGAVKQLLDRNANLIHAKSASQQDYFSKEGGFGGELGGGRSGCIVIPGRGREQTSPGAESRATQLLASLKDYGWVFLSADEAFHIRLCLDIKFGHKIELKVPGKSKVCLDFSDPAFGVIKKDDVVSLAFSAMFDDNFINHICRFDPVYRERLAAFLRDHKKGGENGQGNHHQDVSDERWGYAGTYKSIPVNQGKGIRR